MKMKKESFDFAAATANVRAAQVTSSPQRRTKMWNRFGTVLLMATILAAAILPASCNKHDDIGGARTLEGAWTSVSATGTISYTNQSLSNTVNANMSSYDLTGMVVLDFDAKGKARYADMGMLYRMYDYTLEGDMLTLAYNDGYNRDLYKVALSGDVFTLTHGGIIVGDIQKLVACNLADMELKAVGQGGVTQAGTGVSAIDLTIKFKKSNN
jgi:hypothetical protein